MTDKKIFHRWGGTTDEDLVQQIDAAGGWPVKAKSLVMQHSVEIDRPCYFSTKEDVHDEMNTSIMTADEYYWLKLSDKRKAEHRKQIVSEIRSNLK